MRRDLANYDIDPFQSFIRGRTTNNHVAPFVEDEFAIRDDLRLDAGLRCDHTSENGFDTSPRVALIYAPSADTTLKALLGEAYRAPNAYETTYAGTASAAGVGSSTLDSERIRTLELALSHRFGARRPGLRERHGILSAARPPSGARRRAEERRLDHDHRN